MELFLLKCVVLEENEERYMVDQTALEDPKVQELINVLMDWINDELASQRIIVQDLVEDLYDGQILQKLLEKLTGEKLNVPEVTQSEEGQKHKLSIVLQEFSRVCIYNVFQFAQKLYLYYMF